ncbi:hypothetical protein KQX54_014452 [Cotesia glomerata]|uniref:Uncharacterized protein n=1 Tax=Cotesia glomerata TaxID=32391 RepID=A0AAV7II41_COTGL|nr:hypothetical protein KQX54_014452 [Cotesia glomerata]
MPRKPKVSVDEATEVLKEFILLGNFKDNNFPVKSSEIWTEMSQRLDGKWGPRDVYREVREDRRKILSKAREEVGVASVSSLNMTQEDTNTSETESENDSNSSGSEWEASGTETILLPIDKELFEILHEKEPIMYKKRKYDVLERFKWTSMLAEKIYAFTYLPCAFVFKNAKIYTDEGSIHYLTIRGRCQSKLCGNTILAFLDK